MAPDQPSHQQALHVQHQQQQQRMELVPQQQGQQVEEQQQEAEGQGCTLEEHTLKAIQAGRRRFLRHQAKLDGTLQNPGHDGQLGRRSSSSNSRAVLQPDQVVEAVADLLLDELICAEAQELEGFCDALCDRLVEDEFEDA
jgi:hypothetical protein